MILPTKHLPSDKALLTLGAEVLLILDEPRTVSQVWDRVRAKNSGSTPKRAIGYDWFVLSLDLLFAMGTIRIDRGRVSRVNG